MVSLRCDALLLATALLAWLATLLALYLLPSARSGARPVTSRTGTASPRHAHAGTPTFLGPVREIRRRYSRLSNARETEAACHQAAHSRDRALLDRIVIQPTAPSAAAAPKLLCALYTVSKRGGASDKKPHLVRNESQQHVNARAAAQTWMPRCDGAIAFSDITDESVPTVALQHDGPEAYYNMWQKTRAILKYFAGLTTEYVEINSSHSISARLTYDGGHFLSIRYDYFHLAGDDTLLIVENLRAYLGSAPIAAANAAGTPLFLGRRFNFTGEFATQVWGATVGRSRGRERWHGFERRASSGVHRDREEWTPPPIFNSGGPGYTLNRAALSLLVSLLDTPACHPTARVSTEDVFVAACLWSRGISPRDTRDEKGRERYHPFPPEWHANIRPQGLAPKDWYRQYAIDLRFGDDCCSPHSVAFHFLKAPELRRVYAMLYSCRKGGAPTVREKDEKVI
jgi:hypothetical protein